MIGLTGKDSAITKTLKKLSTGSLKMGNYRAWASCTFLVEIIILENLNLIKRMAEGSISGQENNPIFTRENLSKAKEMVEEHFGGQMEAGMKVSSEMECKVDKESCIERVAILNIKDLGTMACLMGKECNILKMGKSIKVLLSRTNFMEMEFFIRTILLYMEFGKIINYLL